MKKGIPRKAQRHDTLIIPVECFGKIKTSEKPDRFSHYHESTELLYINDGEMKISLRDKPFRLKAGELIVINSNEPHCLEPETQECLCYIIKFNPELLSSFNYTLPFTKEDPLIFSREFVEGTGIAADISDAVNEWNEKRTGYELAVKADVLRILRVLITYFCENGISVNVPSQCTSTQLISGEILQYINENFTNTDEKEIAERFNISYSYFSRSFKSVMNKSFKEYVNYLKINEARKMLIDTDMSIADISSRLGFSSPSHFINVFGQHNGCSPKQYRKNIEKD